MGQSRKIGGKRMGPWTSDLIFAGGRVRVRKTGADLAIDRALLADVLAWLCFYVPVRLKAAFTPPGPRVWFAPDVPRPWYLVWAVAAWAGTRFAASPDKADAAFYFDDQARGAAPAGGPPRRLNYACTDVTKSHVATVFEQVFGYRLTVDPATAAGPLVEKGEANGAHDGRVVQAPCPAAAGKTYQRLIDNSDGAFVDDLRTPCVGGRPVLVFVKRRPVADRFANHNTTVALTAVEDHFSPAEVEAITAFCRAMGLDWGGLDILRDRADGRIYVVDVNKTDMGPPLALRLSDKLAATSVLARAFLSLVRGESEKAG